MKLAVCEVYIEPWGPLLLSFPMGHSQGSVAVDRDQARNVVLFLNIPGKNGEEQVICNLSHLTDIDSSKVVRGHLALRFEIPQILVQVTNESLRPVFDLMLKALRMQQISTSFTKGLQGITALIVKLTSAKKLGNVVRFRTAPILPKALSIDSKVLPEQLFTRHEGANIRDRPKSASPPPKAEPHSMPYQAMNDMEMHVSDNFRDVDPYVSKIYGRTDVTKLLTFWAANSVSWKIYDLLTSKNAIVENSFRIKHSV